MSYATGDVLFWGSQKVVVIKKVLSSAYRVQFAESGSWKQAVVEGRHLSRNRRKPRKYRTTELVQWIGTG